MKRSKTEEKNLSLRESLKDTFLIVASIGTILIGVAALYQGTTSLVWFTFGTTILLLASIYVKWHTKIALIICGIASVICLIGCIFWQEYLNNKQIAELQSLLSSPSVTESSPAPQVESQPKLEQQPLSGEPTPKRETLIPQQRQENEQVKKPKKSLVKPSEEKDDGADVDRDSIGVLEGNVYDYETGQSIQGALIIAQNDSTKNEYQIPSNNSGHFMLPLPVGSYTITITHSNYVTVKGFCKVRDVNGCHVDFARMQKKPQE